MNLFSHFNISEEEGDERRRYGGFSIHQHKEKYLGAYPGNYTWLSRLDNLEKSVSGFSPSEMRYLSFYQSSGLPELNSPAASTDLDNGLQFHAVPHATRKMWYEGTPSAVSGVGQAIFNSFSSQFVTGIQKGGTDSPGAKTHTGSHSKQRYDNHCFLPAASQEHKVIKISFVSGLLIAFYGHGDNTVPDNEEWAVGMAVYCADSRTYSYVRLE